MVDDRRAGAGANPCDTRENRFVISQYPGLNFGCQSSLSICGRGCVPFLIFALSKSTLRILFKFVSAGPTILCGASESLPCKPCWTLTGTSA
jgi:hypothetical protein